MPNRYKFRHVNELAGGFVLIIIMLMVVAVIVVGRSQRWFTPVRQVTLMLPEAGSLGLRKGSDVMVLGTVVGSVDAIDVTDEGEMQAQIHIRSDFMRFVRQDSAVAIRKTLGIGDSYLEISKGRGEELPKIGATLSVTADLAPTQMIEDTIAEVRREAIPTLKQLRVVADQLATLTTQWTDPSGNVQQIVAHASRITADMDHGQGLAAKLLSDKTMADDLATSLTKLNASLSDVQAVLKDLHLTTAKMPDLTASTSDSLKQLPDIEKQMQGVLVQMQAVLKDVQSSTAMLPQTVQSVNQTVNSLPGLVIQTQETLRQTQKFVENAQKSFLFGGAGGEEPASGGRIQSDRVGSEGGGK